LALLLLIPLNNNDVAILKQGNAKQTFKSCAPQCAKGGNAESCVTECMVSQLGLTHECADCFGLDLTCTMANCKMACLVPSSAYCTKCNQDNCGAAINSCIGIPSNVRDILESSSGSVNACINAHDATIMKQGGAKNAFKTCAPQCSKNSDPQSCVANCMVRQLGVSYNCGDCFGADEKCTIQNCKFDCIVPSSDKCVKCNQDHCSSALNSCIGIH